MKQAVTMRLDGQLLAKAKLLAEQEHRTLTNFVEALIKRRVSQSQSPNPPEISDAGPRHAKASNSDPARPFEKRAQND